MTIIRRRSLVLAIVLYLSTFVAGTIPEPCPLTYAVWRASLRWGPVGVYVRDLGVVKSGVEACDVGYDHE